MKPEKAMIEPANVKSKKPRVMSEYVFNESETKRFVLEPIKVVIPPNIAT